MRTPVDPPIVDVLEAIGEVFKGFPQPEQIPQQFGTEDLLYPTEIHTIEFIGDHPGPSAKDLAAHMRVTKGAVSQMVRKLTEKDMVSSTRDYRVRSLSRLTLTDKGRTAYRGHRKLHRRMTARFAEHMGEVSEEAAARVRSICRAVVEDLDRAVETDWTP